tara:strand:- start:3918 stop:4409 length:492 start_codon:yes stop_codon:yes gene_type:complete
MNLFINDKVPDADVFQLIDNEPVKKSIFNYLKNKKVILIGMPGAFTSTCSQKHLPGYINHLENFRLVGIDNIICICVNDPFVMGAWGKINNTKNDILMLADPFAEFTKKLGAEIDKSDRGLGIRSKRYTMILKDTKVTYLATEKETSHCEISAAENILSKLKE